MYQTLSGFQGTIKSFLLDFPFDWLMWNQNESNQNRNQSEGKPTRNQEELIVKQKTPWRVRKFKGLSYICFQLLPISSVKRVVCFMNCRQSKCVKVFWNVISCQYSVNELYINVTRCRSGTKLIPKFFHL